MTWVCSRSSLTSLSRRQGPPISLHLLGVHLLEVWGPSPWGQTDLEFSPQEILNRSDPKARPGLPKWCPFRLEPTRGKSLPRSGISPENTPSILCIFPFVAHQLASARKKSS